MLVLFIKEFNNKYYYYSTRTGVSKIHSTYRCTPNKRTFGSTVSVGAWSVDPWLSVILCPRSLCTERWTWGKPELRFAVERDNRVGSTRQPAWDRAEGYFVCYTSIYPHLVFIWKNILYYDRYHSPCHIAKRLEN